MILTVVLLSVFHCRITQVILNEDLIVNFNNITTYCNESEMVELQCYYVVDIDITGPIFLNCPRWIPFNVTLCVIKIFPIESEVTCKAGYIAKSTKFIERCSDAKRQTMWSTVSKALLLGTLYLGG